MINLLLRILIFLLIASTVVFIAYNVNTFIIDSIHNRKPKKNITNQNISKQGVIGYLNTANFVDKFGRILANKNNLQKIFDKAKNPWGVSIATFQFIRIILPIILGIITIFIFVFHIPYIGFTFAAFTAIALFYPMHYYKNLGEEREKSWNRMYEYLWLLTSHLKQTDVVKSLTETQKYVAAHSPYNKELIQGLDDMRTHWVTGQRSAYLEQYYSCMIIPKEIIDIMFTFEQTGIFQEESFIALRAIMINKQNAGIRECLGKVETQATLDSLPFLLLSVCVSLLFPILSQMQTIL